MNRHDIVTLSTLLSLPRDVSLKGLPLSDVHKQLEVSHRPVKSISLTLTLTPWLGLGLGLG